MLLLVCIAILLFVVLISMILSFYSLYCDIVQSRDLVGFLIEICYKKVNIIFKNNYLVRSFHIIFPDLNITLQPFFFFFLSLSLHFDLKLIIIGSYLSLAGKLKHCKIIVTESEASYRI